jgi:hypothetical protein
VVHALVVGTFHFVSRLDMVQPDVVDMTTHAAQREIADVVECLASYRPTKVVLELPAADKVQINSRYRAYLAGERSLDGGEREQVGFRLAGRLGHPACTRSTSCTAGGSPRSRTWPRGIPRAGEVWADLEEKSRAAAEEGTARLHTLTVREHLALMNAPESQDVMGDYLTHNRGRQDGSATHHPAQYRQPG